MFEWQLEASEGAKEGLQQDLKAMAKQLEDKEATQLSLIQELEAASAK